MVLRCFLQGTALARDKATLYPLHVCSQVGRQAGRHGWQAGHLKRSEGEVDFLSTELCTNPLRPADVDADADVDASKDKHKDKVRRIGLYNQN